MILHAEERRGTVAKALVRVVVQIEVRNFDVAGGKRIGIDAKTMVLRSDFDFPCEQILNRMIRSVMAEFELVGFAAERETAELMPQTNAKDRHLSEQLANVCDGVRDWFGIARAVRQEYAFGFHREHIRC